MPRILITTNDRSHFTLNERVQPQHLDDEHHAQQFIERLAWAIHDAETAEGRYQRLIQPVRHYLSGLNS